MLDFYVIGTSGAIPQVDRRLSSAMIRSEGSIILIDAGEGTQLGIRSSGWSAKSIDTILFTHLHSDHVLGLAGVLLLMNNSGRTEPVVIAGPKGIKRYTNSLYLTLPELNFPLYFIELANKEEFIQAGTIEVDAFQVNHSVTCYGYSFYRRRPGKFDVNRASKVPKRAWCELSKGYATLDKDGNKVKNNEILGPERKGIKITYVTDTRPTESILQYAAYSDLFVCEGMYVGYGDTEGHDEINKIKNYHMTFLEAAALAKNANVSRLLLTHFNPSIRRPNDKLDEAKQIFENVSAATDDLHIEMFFEENKLFDKSLKNSKNVKGSITKENPYNDYMCFEDRNTRKVSSKNGNRNRKNSNRRFKGYYDKNKKNYYKNGNGKDYYNRKSAPHKD